MYNIEIMSKELKVEKREKKQEINESKDIKGNLYGKELKENVSVVFKYVDFKKLYQEVGGSIIFSLNVEGEEYDVLVKEVQYNPRNDLIIHVDFYAIVKGQEMEVNVPFEFIGESLAIKNGGVLNTQLSEVSLKTLPKNIPSLIEIDLSKLENEDDTIRLGDIKLPKDVKFVTENMDEIVVSVMKAVEVEDEIDDAEVEFNDGKEEEKTEEVEEKEDKK